MKLLAAALLAAAAAALLPAAPAEAASTHTLFSRTVKVMDYTGSVVTAHEGNANVRIAAYCGGRDLNFVQILFKYDTYWADLKQGSSTVKNTMWLDGGRGKFRVMLQKGCRATITVTQRW